jgi:adenylyltransferase/sulfurtransferase
MIDPRYSRQVLLPQIGQAGQARLSSSSVLLVGCGALGSVIAEQLVRAGIGFLRIVDRDIVELSNLQRQVLFDESDARDGMPKAIAAKNRLGAINSSTKVESSVADLNARNVQEFVQVQGSSGKVDLVLDGTDNVGTRYLLNDVAVKCELPWVYGGCVGTEGRVLAIRPGVTACLRCVFPEPPEPADLPTCDTAGVLGPVAGIVASLQVIAAMKMLLDPSSGGEMIRLQGWNAALRVVDTRGSRRADCVTCSLRRFEFLDNPAATGAVLCGRDAVQVLPERAGRFDLDRLAARLGTAADIEQTPYLLRCAMRDDQSIRLSVFPDGRAIVHGTSDTARARSLYARYVGA